jgi:hypothetical protein
MFIHSSITLYKSASSSSINFYKKLFFFSFSAQYIFAFAVAPHQLTRSVKHREKEREKKKFYFLIINNVKRTAQLLKIAKFCCFFLSSSLTHLLSIIRCYVQIRANEILARHELMFVLPIKSMKK